MSAANPVKSVVMPDDPFQIMGGMDAGVTYALGDPDKRRISFPRAGIIIQESGEFYFKHIIHSLAPGTFTWFLPTKDLVKNVDELSSTQDLLDSGKKTSGCFFKVDLAARKEELTNTINKSLKAYFGAIKVPTRVQRIEFFLMNGTEDQLYGMARGQLVEVNQTEQTEQQHKTESEL